MARIVLATALLALFSLAPSASAQQRVGVVDMALVYRQYPEVIKTTYFLKQKKDEYQEEIDRDRRKIEELSEPGKDAPKPGAKDDAQVKERENTKRRLLFELQTKFQRYKTKLQDLEQEEFEKIREAVKTALSKLARTRRIDLVIEKQWAYYGESEDLTEALITSLGGEVPGKATAAGGK